MSLLYPFLTIKMWYLYGKVVQQIEICIHCLNSYYTALAQYDKTLYSKI